MDEYKELLQKYANTVLKIGVNLQPEQVLMLESPIESIDFTRILVQRAYELGAKYVQVNWGDEVVTRTRFETASDDSFSYYPKWNAEMMEQLAESGGALLHIKTPDPELFRGIDPKKVAAATTAASQARQKFQSYVRRNKLSWCLVKAPSKAWADKVYPDLPAEQRISQMWQDIFYMNRVDQENPVEAWKEHIAELKQMQDRLNGKKYKKLHYRAPGTNLEVELPEGHLWVGGGSYNQKGIFFVPNMPTEEVFTMPVRTGVNGTVRSTKPLNLNGNLIDRFSFTFKGGKVVDYTAEVGYDHLTSLLERDEGSSYLGEIALVPHDSPISNLNRIFYNTGVDENASCHLALGSAYPFNLKDGTLLSKEELLARGANVSMTHVDFMIGSAELDIDGELADGTKEPLFRKGNWVV